jgi:hypothetical protein
MTKECRMTKPEAFVIRASGFFSHSSFVFRHSVQVIVVACLNYPPPKTFMNLSELTKLYDFTGRTVAITGATGVLMQQHGRNLDCLRRQRGPWSFEIGQRRTTGCSPAGPGQAFVVVSDALDRKSLDQAAETIIGRLVSLTASSTAPAVIIAGNCASDQSFFDLTPDGLRSVLDLNWMGTVFALSVFWKAHGQAWRRRDFKCFVDGCPTAVDARCGLFCSQGRR